MSTFKDKTIAATYARIVKRADTYVQTGTQIEIMDDSGTMEPTGLYLEGHGGMNVGIRTAAPNKHLCINNAVDITAGASKGHIAFDGGDGKIYLRDNNDTTSGWAINHAGAPAGDLLFTYSSTDVMSVGADGNVGIGTTDPDNGLDIVKGTSNTDNWFKVGYDSGSTASARVSIVPASRSAGVFGDSVKFVFNGRIGDSSLGSRAGMIGWKAEDNTNDAPFNKGTLVFNSRGDVDLTQAGVGTCDMVINNGNVGIGTTAPSKALDIKAAKSVDGDVIYAQVNILDTTAYGAYPTSGIRFQGYDTGTTAFTMGGIYMVKKNTTEYNESSVMRFLTRENGSDPAIRMTILQDGNVGIGDIDPSYPLSVKGNGSNNYVAIFDNTGTGATHHGIRIQAGDTNHDGDSSTHYIQFLESDWTTGASNLVGEIDITSGDLQFNNSSDYRLKENISAIAGGLAKVNALKPSYFNYKRYPNKIHQGFIAHEVQDAGIDYAVTGDKDAMETKVTPAVEAVVAVEAVSAKEAVLDGDGNIVEEAVKAVEAVEAIVAVPEKTEQVDDNQMLAITNLIPQMVSAIQELSAKVTALENNNNQGESNGESNQGSEDSNSGEPSSESSGEDSGGTEGSSDESSSSSESVSGDDSESSGSSGGDSSDDS